MDYNTFVARDANGNCKLTNIDGVNYCYYGYCLYTIGGLS